MAVTREQLDQMAKDFVDAGKLIEAGFISLRIAAIPVNATDGQISAMRMAFFAGAQHLLGAIMQFLDPDEEISDADMRRMDLIAHELDEFANTFDLDLPTEGKA